MELLIDQELKNLIPPLSVEEYGELEKSILAEGCRDAIVTWNGTIVDGHNRYEICTKHGISFKTIGRQFADKGEVAIWMVKNQIARRNVEKFVGIELLEKAAGLGIAEKNREKMNKVENLVQFKGSDPAAPTSAQPVERDRTTNTSYQLAALAGVGHDTYHKAKVIIDKAPEELKQQLRAGEVSINQAYQTVRREEKKAVVREKEKAVELKPTGSVDIATTEKKYNIIYADPAWQYFEGGNKNQSCHYTTMTIEEICKLPVSNIADEDCILFMWVTAPILDRAFEVIKAWGFKYSTVGFVWVKQNKEADTPFFGLGSWTRSNAEMCLIATKGSITRMDASVSQIIQAPIGEHSAKPECVYGKIEQLVGKLPRIELFSRADREGWDRWGNGI